MSSRLAFVVSRKQRVRLPQSHAAPPAARYDGMREGTRMRTVNTALCHCYSVVSVKAKASTLPASAPLNRRQDPCAIENATRAVTLPYFTDSDTCKAGVYSSLNHSAGRTSYLPNLRSCYVKAVLPAGRILDLHLSSRDFVCTRDAEPTTTRASVETLNGKLFYDTRQPSKPFPPIHASQY
eukprot:6191174-Pleurochrysis_carterae.AAC.2